MASTSSINLQIVIVNYRVTDLTMQCLRSLPSEVASVCGCRVAICENGTGPEAASQLQECLQDHGWGEWAYLREVYPNRGFTGGNNVILAEAMVSPQPPRYFLLLNADTIVLPGAIRTLVEFMDTHPQVGVAGSRIENPDGTRQCSPFRFQNCLTELDRGLKLGLVSRLLSRWKANPPEPKTPARADWVSGASIIVRREVFEQIGLLDEGLYTYFDDIDFCLNAWRSGWQVWYVPQSRVLHLGGQSTGIGQRNAPPARRPSYWFQARRRFFLKNHGPLRTLLADTAFLAGFVLWRMRRAVQRKPDTDPPHMLWDAFRHSVLCTGFKLRVVPNPALVEYEMTQNKKSKSNSVRAVPA
jgi:N-acetylglucosaminyl-diphospho-decaprenol L-rhamnosyltransferase